MHNLLLLMRVIILSGAVLLLAVTIKNLRRVEKARLEAYTVLRERMAKASPPVKESVATWVFSLLARAKSQLFLFPQRMVCCYLDDDGKLHKMEIPFADMEKIECKKTATGRYRLSVWANGSGPAVFVLKDGDAWAEEIQRLQKESGTL